jgi:hypothetical protein
MIQAVLQVPGEIEIVVVPPVNEVGGRIGKVVHPLSNVPQRTGRWRLVHDPDLGVIEAERNGMLVVDEARSLSKWPIAAGNTRASQRAECLPGSHQAVDFSATAKAAFLESRLTRRFA